MQCHDAAWPHDWARWRTDTTKLHAKAPFLTWTNAWYNAPCAFWPEKAGTPVKIQGSKKLPPIMLVQAERDAATPYAGAVRMRKLFDSARLLVVPTGNHGVSLRGTAAWTGVWPPISRTAPCPVRPDMRPKARTPAARALPRRCPFPCSAKS